MPLNDAAIKALKSKATRYSVTDNRGLTLEVFPTGGKSWRYRYRLNGKLEKVVLGKYPDLSLKAARAKRDEFAAMVAQGRSPAVDKQARKRAVDEAMPVSEFVEHYFKEVAQKDRRDCRSIRRYIDKEIVPAVGRLSIQAVKAEDIRPIVWKKKEHGRDAAAADIRGLLKRIFDYAMSLGLRYDNPTSGLPSRYIFKPKPRERALSIDEIGAFLTAVYSSSMRRQFKIALHVILLTMVRKSELLLAKWSEVDLERAEWHLPAANTKTKTPHIVFLSRQTVDLFVELKKLAFGSELVLPGRNSPTKGFAANALNAALKTALKNDPLPAFTIHDLRRTASTLLHEYNWNSDVIEKALNHKIGGIRGVYNRAQYAEQRRELLQYWADTVEVSCGSTNSITPLSRGGRVAWRGRMQ